MFTPKELEVIKAIGKPKPDEPLTDEDDVESLNRSIEQIIHETEIMDRYFTWLRAYTDNLSRIDNALYESRPVDWRESRGVIAKFGK